ncbi:MAG: hypothetical protein Q9211_002739 [Gyalolechia sp. 1 TL-2023]
MSLASEGFGGDCSEWSSGPSLQPSLRAELEASVEMSDDLDWPRRPRNGVQRLRRVVQAIDRNPNAASGGPFSAQPLILDVGVSPRSVKLQKILDPCHVPEDLIDDSPVKAHRDRWHGKGDLLMQQCNDCYQVDICNPKTKGSRKPRLESVLF